MKQVFALIISALFYCQATAQVTLQVENPDSVLITDIAADYDRIAAAVELEFNKLKQQVQDDINKDKARIQELSKANKLLPSEIKRLEAQLVSQRSWLDSLVRLNNELLVNPFASAYSLLPVVQKSIDSMQHIIIPKTQSAIAEKNSMISQNKQEQIALQADILKLQQQIQALENEKQKTLAEIGKQKQNAIQLAIKLSNDKQSILLNNLSGKAKAFENRWVRDSIPSIKTRYRLNQ